jgi:lysophospholipase L1-like esterase
MTAGGRLLSALVAMVIAVGGFVTLGAPTAAAGPTGTLQYVALGDSYAAGVGAPPYSGSCLQSSNGYPALLGPKGRIDLQDNATCAGAKTFDVRDYVVGPQLALNPDTRLVTLTVGGNDLGFAGLAETCTTPGMERGCLAAIKAIGPLQFQELGSHLTDLYGDVAEAAPKALIVVTGYPHLVESTAPFDPVLIAALNSAWDALNRTIREAVLAANPTGDNIVYVDVTDAFAGHGIGSSDDPFIIGPTPGVSRVEDFHPNAAGYRAYAKAISAAM